MGRRWLHPESICLCNRRSPRPSWRVLCLLMFQESHFIKNIHAWRFRILWTEGIPRRSYSSPWQCVLSWWNWTLLLASTLDWVRWTTLVDLIRLRMVLWNTSQPLVQRRCHVGRWSELLVLQPIYCSVRGLGLLYRILSWRFPYAVLLQRWNAE